MIVLCACAAPLPAPDQPGARDTYRAVLDADAKGPRAREARERLEAAEWDNARAAHTIFAYRRFLKEFEDSRHAPEARQLLEGLRWTQADKDGSETALAAYVSDESRGAHAQEAWARLSSLRLLQAVQSGSAVSLRSWLAENPAAAGRDKGKLAQLARRPGPFAGDAARDLAFLRKDSRRAALLEAAAHKLYLPRATLDELPEEAPRRALRLREWAAAFDGSRLHRM